MISLAAQRATLIIATMSASIVNSQVEPILASFTGEIQAPSVAHDDRSLTL